MEKKWGDALLFLANAILYICRGKKIRIADHFYTTIVQETAQGNVDFEIPDFCYDKHTARGRKLGRGWDHWREEGCKLSNKAEIPDPYEDKAFKLWKTEVKLDKIFGKDSNGGSE